MQVVSKSKSPIHTLSLVTHPKYKTVDLCTWIFKTRNCINIVYILQTWISEPTINWLRIYHVELLVSESLGLSHCTQRLKFILPDHKSKKRNWSHLYEYKYKKIFMSYIIWTEAPFCVLTLETLNWWKLWLLHKYRFMVVVVFDCMHVYLGKGKWYVFTVILFEFSKIIFHKIRIVVFLFLFIQHVT
jgi:hypothetical protein